MSRPSLTRTLIGRQIGLLVIMLWVLGVTQLVVLRQVLLNATARSLQDELAVLAPLLHHSLKQRTFTSLIPILFNRFRAPGVEVVLANPLGFAIADSPTLPANVVPPMPSPGHYMVWANHIVAGTVMRTHGHLLGSIWLMTSTAPMTQILYRDIELFGLLSLLVLGAVAWLGVVSVRRTLAPLDDAVTATELIAAGDYGRTVDFSGAPRELARLGVSITRMSKKVADSFQAEREAQAEMRRFVADASHELRTPLAALAGFLELWDQGQLTGPDEATGIAAMRRETGRMTRLVQQLLTLSRLDAGASQEVRTEVCRLDAWLKDSTPALRALAGDRLTVEAEPATVLADPDRLVEVVMNLVDNALRYSTPGGTIRVASNPQPDGLGGTLTVEDDGPGIPRDVLPHIFDRFFRQDPARSQATGAGLGLAIVRALVEAQGGTVHAENKPSGGARFTVSLPGPEAN